MNQAQTLEQAILARAERLAGEFRERGKRARDTILRDAAERLRLREGREEAIAKALGERTYRQQVQAEELHMQSNLDRVRWNLVLDVEGQLAGRMTALINDPESYLRTLRGFIDTAVAQIERPALAVHANARDLRLLGGAWTDISRTLPPDKQVTLAADPIEILGGVLVVSDDRRIRVDNTFEGRRSRLRLRLQQVILERLLPNGYETGSVFGG